MFVVVWVTGLESSTPHRQTGKNLQADIRHEPQVDPAVLAQAIATATAAGYVVIKAKSYRAAQERQRIAEALKEAAERQIASTERWARDCCQEERRIRDRLTFVYGVAQAFGATTGDLRGNIAPEDQPALQLLDKMDARGEQYVSVDAVRSALHESIGRVS